MMAVAARGYGGLLLVGALAGCTWGACVEAYKWMDRNPQEDMDMPWQLRPVIMACRMTQGAFLGTAAGVVTAATLPVTLPVYAVRQLVSASTGRVSHE
jgi:hypothetical protein